MNPELQKKLEESLALTEKLLLYMESDRDDMHRCIQGAVFDAYSSASNEAEEVVREIRKSLMILQAGHKPGM